MTEVELVAAELVPGASAGLIGPYSAPHGASASVDMSALANVLPKISGWPFAYEGLVQMPEQPPDQVEPVHHFSGSTPDTVRAVPLAGPLHSAQAGRTSPQSWLTGVTDNGGVA